MATQMDHAGKVFMTYEKNEYVVRGVDNNGNVVYYTGCAGERWISKNIWDAFSYSLEGARRKATKFNLFTKTHGVHFIAMAR